MKPHLEARNERMRQERVERCAKGEDYWSVVADLAIRWHVTEDTADEILRNPKYGHYIQAKRKQKRPNQGALGVTLPAKA